MNNINDYEPSMVDTAPTNSPLEDLNNGRLYSPDASLRVTPSRPIRGRGRGGARRGRPPGRQVRRSPYAPPPPGPAQIQQNVQNQLAQQQIDELMRRQREQEEELKQLRQQQQDQQLLRQQLPEQQLQYLNPEPCHYSPVETECESLKRIYI